MRNELEWLFIGLWPLDTVDDYIFQWITLCEQFRITGLLLEDGRSRFDCYAKGAEEKWELVMAGLPNLEWAKHIIGRYYQGGLTKHRW